MPIEQPEKATPKDNANHKAAEEQQAKPADALREHVWKPQAPPVTRPLTDGLSPMIGQPARAWPHIAAKFNDETVKEYSARPLVTVELAAAGLVNGLERRASFGTHGALGSLGASAANYLIDKTLFNKTSYSWGTLTADCFVAPLIALSKAGTIVRIPLMVGAHTAGRLVDVAIDRTRPSDRELNEQLTQSISREKASPSGKSFRDVLSSATELGKENCPMLLKHASDANAAAPKNVSDLCSAAALNIAAGDTVAEQGVPGTFAQFHVPHLDMGGSAETFFWTAGAHLYNARRLEDSGSRLSGMPQDYRPLMDMVQGRLKDLNKAHDIPAAFEQLKSACKHDMQTGRRFASIIDEQLQQRMSTDRYTKENVAKTARDSALMMLVFSDVYLADREPERARLFEGKAAQRLELAQADTREGARHDLKALQDIAQDIRKRLPPVKK